MARARCGVWVIGLLAWMAGRGGPAAAGPEEPSSKFHLGKHTRRITTSSPAAQAAFDRGLTLSYAFSHGAAEQAFRQAAEADPACAMAWWGVALVNGPHINLPIMLPDQVAASWEALEKARARSQGASPVEQALIGALAKRYANPAPADRRPLDEAYAAAMREVAQAFPRDADVATLLAEALMDLRPWDLWTNAGQPQPGTEEILSVLERALALDPRHPGALHLKVHAVEASPHPEAGLEAADLLRDLVPGAGHLVHMPAHIYGRLGRWRDAAEANLRAIDADDYYRTQHPQPGFYAVYMAHNRHFLAFSAMMRGRSAEALQAGREMVAGVPSAFVAAFAPLVDGFLIFPSEVLMRFGRWEQILAEPEPAETLPLSRALARFTRAVAQAALHRPAEADKEREAFRAAAQAVPAEWTFGNNPAAAILAIAAAVADGELAAQRGSLDEAVRALEQAVRLEDALRYDEPPDWILPTRHTLGATLLVAGRAAEAEAVFRADLARWPANVWALAGLARSLHLQGKHAEAHATDASVKTAWADADIPIPTTSCLCLPGK